MRSTRRDVALRAGVSTATVTYVLNGTKSISPATTERVLKAVEELNYRPDQIAKSLATHRSMQLGVVVDNLSNPLYGSIVHGFEAAASERGYFVSICTSHRRYSDALENAVVRRLDGIFVMIPAARYDKRMLERLSEAGIAAITSGDLEIDVRRFSSIENDYAQGVRDLMEYLYARGHREIAFLTGLSRESSYDGRAQAYLDTVQALNLPCGDDLLIDTRPEFATRAEDGYELARRLLRTRRPFTAAIFVNDLTAMGAYAAFREAGLRIPEDVAVAGVDDIEFCKYVTPSLTSLSFDKIQYGAKAFDLLYAQMTEGVTGYYLNKLTLIPRQSTEVNR